MSSAITVIAWCRPCTICVRKQTSLNSVNCLCNERLKTWHLCCNVNMLVFFSFLYSIFLHSCVLEWSDFSIAASSMNNRVSNNFDKLNSSLLSHFISRFFCSISGKIIENLIWNPVIIPFRNCQWHNKKNLHHSTLFVFELK